MEKNNTNDQMVISPIDDCTNHLDKISGLIKELFSTDYNEKVMDIVNSPLSLEKKLLALEKIQTKLQSRNPKYITDRVYLRSPDEIKRHYGSVDSYNPYEFPISNKKVNPISFIFFDLWKIKKLLRSCPFIKFHFLPIHFEITKNTLTYFNKIFTIINNSLYPLFINIEKKGWLYLEKIEYNLSINLLGLFRIIRIEKTILNTSALKKILPVYIPLVINKDIKSSLIRTVMKHGSHATLHSSSTEKYLAQINTVLGGANNPDLFNYLHTLLIYYMKKWISRESMVNFFSVVKTPLQYFNISKEHWPDYQQELIRQTNQFHKIIEQIWINKCISDNLNQVEYDYIGKNEVISILKKTLLPDEENQWLNDNDAVIFFTNIFSFFEEKLSVLSNNEEQQRYFQNSIIIDKLSALKQFNVNLKQHKDKYALLNTAVVELLTGSLTKADQISLRKTVFKGTSLIHEISIQIFKSKLDVFFESEIEQRNLYIQKPTNFFPIPINEFLKFCILFWLWINQYSLDQLYSHGKKYYVVKEKMKAELKRICDNDTYNELEKVYYPVFSKQAI